MQIYILLCNYNWITLSPICFPNFDVEPALPALRALPGMFQNPIIIINSLNNVWYGPYLGPRRLLRTQGKIGIIQEKHLAHWRETYKPP